MGKVYGIFIGAIGLAATAGGSYMFKYNYDRPLTIKQADVLSEAGNRLITQGKDAQYLALSGNFNNPKKSFETVTKIVNEISGSPNASKAKELGELTTELFSVNKNLDKNTKPEIYGPTFVSAGNKLNHVANTEGTDRMSGVLAGVLAGCGLFFFGITCPLYKEP